jgi:hypothetical protein
VESCVALDLSTLRLLSKLSRSGCLTAGDNSMGYEVNTCDPSDAWLDLTYTVSLTGEEIRCRTQLITTRLPSGGLRWWIVCPLVKNGQTCGARVRKLYLPPGARYFGCRDCYDLTYTSAQTHDKRLDPLFRSLRRAWG